MNFLFLGICAPSLAAETALNGDLKQFFTVTNPYDSLLLPPKTHAQAFIDGRLKLSWKPTESLRFEAHHVVTSGTLAPQNQLMRELTAMGVEPNEENGSGVFMTGVGLNAPEAVELSWAVDDEELFLQGRTDRLWIRQQFGRTDVTVGRQAIGFGNGLAFNPLDLVQPFSFATIDSEYKPGVDAFRVDQYLGMSSQIGALLAYSGDWDKDGITAMVTAKHPLGPTELSYLVASVRSDLVFGVGSATSIGPVGVHVDFTVTEPDQTKEDPFARVVAGVFTKPFEPATLTAEIYFQSLGAAEPEKYLEFAETDRFARGELWLLGRTYASVAWTQELGPLLTTTLASTVNIEDGSAFLSPTGSYSISDDVQAIFGGFIGLGERPDSPDINELLSGEVFEVNSEFGLYPSSIFIQMRAYL